MMTFEWFGSLVATAIITAFITNAVTSFVIKRKSSNGNGLFNQVFKALEELRFDSCRHNEALARLECLPGKIDQTNALLNRIAGLLEAKKEK